MATIKSWYKIDGLTPRQDLRDSKPLDVLAWEDIRDEEKGLDHNQEQQLKENLKKCESNLKESVWNAYKYVALLGKDNKILVIDFGQVNSSQSTKLVGLSINRLRQSDDVIEGEIATQKMEETKVALSELGLNNDVRTDI
jgi:hypothetical protein